MRKSRVLRTLITERPPLVVPGCHDALSASVIEKCGFSAVQVSGFGLAGAQLSRPDVGFLSMKEILDLTRNIAKAVQIPVMADIDTGGGNAMNAAVVTETLIEMGVAGMNIEDQVFPKRCGHMSGKEIIPREEMMGKIRACADARDRLDSDFVINARTDAYAVAGLDEAIARGNLYFEAGADLAFIDGIGGWSDIQRAVKELSGPLSVNLMDGVTGVKTELIPVTELGRMGVARVSIPVASILVTHKALMDFLLPYTHLRPAFSPRRRTDCRPSTSTPNSSVSRNAGTWKRSICQAGSWTVSMAVEMLHGKRVNRPHPILVHVPGFDSGGNDSHAERDRGRCLFRSDFLDRPAVPRNRLRDR